MPFLLLIALLFACLPIAWREPVIDWGVSGSILATAWLVTLVLCSATVLAYLTARQVESAPDQLSSILHRYSTLRMYHGLGLVAAFALSLLMFGWGWAIEQVGSVPWGDQGEVLLPGAELVVVAPFFLMLIGSWACFYAVDRATYGATHPKVAPTSHDPNTPSETERPFPGRMRYILFHLRQYLLLLILPLGLLIVQQGAARLWPDWFEGNGSRVALLAAVIGVVLLFPLSLPPLLGLRPLPPGSTRDRLTAIAQRLRLRYREMMVWETHGAVANAMVVGFIAPARYIIVTDRLMDELTDQQVNAVFGHEAGHVKHGHLAFYGSFLLLSMLAFSAGWTVAAPWIGKVAGEQLGHYEDWFIALPMMLMAIYIFVVFGFISRRCERQADIFGCRVASASAEPNHEASTPLPLTPQGVEAFVSALETVCRINGVTRPPSLKAEAQTRRRQLSLPGRFLRTIVSWLNSWQHSTVTRRVAFLKRMLNEPDVEPRFQRRLGWLKWGVIVVLSGIVIGLGVGFGWEVLVSSL